MNNWFSKVHFAGFPLKTSLKRPRVKSTFPRFPVSLRPTKGLRALAVLSLLLLTACGGDEPAREKQEFTRERPDFTRDHQESDASGIFFTDVTGEAGIDFVHVNGAFGKKWMPETIGSGGGFLDYDGDGHPDIFLVNSSDWPGHPTQKSPPTAALYRNKGDGSFENVTAKAGLDLTLYGMGAVFGDYDGDGDPDIYITAVGDNHLLRNDEGRFTDVTRQSGVAGNSSAPGVPPAWSTGAAFVDVDRDGWLDLFVANYVKWSPETDIYTTRDGKTKSYATPDVYAGETCRLFRNIGGKRFEEITESAGVLNEEGKSLGVVATDINNDGWPDIAVSNDTQPNFLYINNGDGTFTDRAIEAGMGFDENGRARAGMGIDVADVANNNRLAIAIGNFSGEPISLYTQIGEGNQFQDRAGPARLNRASLPALTFGLHFADIDLDGYLDLLAANGHIEPEINAVQQAITFAQTPLIFRNYQGQFVDLSEQAGAPFAEPMVARGVATADIDGDGDSDVLFTVNGDRPRLLRNEVSPTKTRWVKLKLTGNKPNPGAVGALVVLWSRGIPQRRMVRTGSSYLTQSQNNPLTFGLGEADFADSVTVHWPTSGKISRVGQLVAGQIHSIAE